MAGEVFGDGATDAAGGACHESSATREIDGVGHQQASASRAFRPSGV